MTWRIENNASDPVNADLTGGALSMGLMAGIGVAEDLSTGDYKYENLLASAAGAGFSVLRNRIPGLAEKVDFRLEYLPSGDGSPLDFVSDYMGQNFSEARRISEIPGDASAFSSCRWVTMPGLREKARTSPSASTISTPASG